MVLSWLLINGIVIGLVMKYAHGKHFLLFIVLVVGFFNTFRFIFSCLYLVGRARRGALKCICFSRKEQPFKYEDLVDRFDNSADRRAADRRSRGGGSAVNGSLQQPLVDFTEDVGNGHHGRSNRPTTRDYLAPDADSVGGGGAAGGKQQQKQTGRAAYSTSDDAVV